MYISIGAPRTFDVAKSTGCVCWRARRVATLVGNGAATAASVSSPADLLCSLATAVASWMAANRSAIGISAVGTSMRITEKALAPDDSVRVLTAIDARRASVGLPILMWYFDAASAAAVMNAGLSGP